MSFHKFAWHLGGFILSVLRWLAPFIASHQSADPEEGELAAPNGGGLGIGAQPTATGGGGVFSRYYGILGAGLLRNQICRQIFNPEGVTIVKAQRPVQRNSSHRRWLRYYIARNWGIWLEVKVIVKPTYNPGSVGNFYVTPA